jgi:hypothetical protein
MDITVPRDYSVKTSPEFDPFKPTVSPDFAQKVEIIVSLDVAM